MVNPREDFEWSKKMDCERNQLIAFQRRANENDFDIQWGKENYVNKSTCAAFELWEALAKKCENEIDHVLMLARLGKKQTSGRSYC